MAELAVSFAQLYDQIADLIHPSITRNAPRGLIRAMYALGAGIQTSGFKHRCCFPFQAEVVDLLKNALSTFRGTKLNILPTLNFSDTLEWTLGLRNTLAGSWVNRTRRACAARFLSFTRDVLRPRSLIGPRLISRSPGVGLWKGTKANYSDLFLQPKNSPTAPKKIPLETGKTEEPNSGVSRVSSTQVYNFTIFKRSFFGGPHLLLARCSGDVIFFWGFSPSPTNGCELHHQKMTNRETGKFSNVKS